MALTQVKTSGLADDAVTGAKIADDTVAEANMANDAISLTELKAGTDGQIITWDASGNPTAVGPGTDGQVLTSTGAGSPPAFETLPTSGAALTGSTNNTVVTVTGANAMAGEANLTFDGGTLQQAIDANDEGYTILADGNHRPTIVGDRDATGEHDELLHLVGKWNNTQVGAIDIQAGADTSNKDDGHIIFYTSPASGSLNNRMKIHNDGQVSITDGDLVIGTSGHGISFAATGGPSNGSGTSELLDDYEEGTWTPDLYHQGAENKAGFYTKIGRIVFAAFELQALNASGNSNNQLISGLPFTVKNASPLGGCARGWQNYASDLGPLYQPSANATTCHLYTNNGTNLAAQTLGTTQLRGVLVYITDS